MSSILIDDSFQVTVSHICKHWREVALGTPTLWSEIDLETGRRAVQSHRRASAYLIRSKGYRLSVCIDVNECDLDDTSFYSGRSDYQSPDTNVQLQEAVDLLLLHIGQGRKFKLVAEDYLYFHTVLSRLSTAPPAPLLEYLKLHHIDEDLELNYLMFPDDHTPKLQYVSLYQRRWYVLIFVIELTC